MSSLRLSFIGEQRDGAALAKQGSVGSMPAGGAGQCGEQQRVEQQRVEQGNVGSRTAPVGWSASVVLSAHARRERHRLIKQSFFPCSLHVRGGRRKGNSAVQNGTVRSFLFFFLYETASF